MRSVFLDTNILTDILAHREPFYETSAEIYRMALLKKINCFTSSNTISTLHYLLKKYIEENKIRNALGEIIDVITIIPVDYKIIKTSLKSVHRNFEDAIQIVSSKSINEIDCIITRDLKDYKNAEIDVFTTDEFLDNL